VGRSPPQGLGNSRLVRYADDCLLMACGNRERAVQMRERAAAVLAPMGLRLSAEKTSAISTMASISRLAIQRHCKRGTNRYYVYTYPSRKAIKAVTGQDDVPAQRQPAAPDPDRQLNPALRGWCAYFQTRRVLRRLLGSGQIHVGPVPAMGATQTPPDHTEDRPSPLLQRRMVADYTGDRTVQPG
jgi:hypothetical protein